MHLLVIAVLAVVVWKIATSGPASPQAALAIATGLRRLGLVLAVLAALLGAVIGYSGYPPDLAKGMIGAVVGFGLLWGLTRVVIWIAAGFLGRP
jgi:hypothetical protein